MLSSTVVPRYYRAKKGYSAWRVLPNGAFRRFSVVSANSAKFGKTKWGGGGGGRKKNEFGGGWGLSAI
jgi:hypothetical protein